MKLLRRNLIGLTCVSLLATSALAQQPPQPSPDRAPPRPVGVVPEMSEPETAIIPIQNANANAVHEVLARTAPAFGGAVIVAQESTNTLVIVADKQTALPKLIAIVKELDKPASAGGDDRAVQSIALKKAFAHDAAAAIDRLMVGRSGMRVWSDERSNTLWLRGSSTEITAATELATRFDAAAPESPEVSAAAAPSKLQFLRLKHAHAQHLGTTVNALFGKSERDVRIVADARSQTLVVQCTDAQFARISEVVVALDVPARDGDVVTEHVSPPPAESDKPADRPHPSPGRPAKPGQP
ncbi:MAG: secretin N-terminal domain-containing protein [Phycisphaerae bacterium]